MEKHVRVDYMAKQYECRTSTICTILKQESIKAIIYPRKYGGATDGVGLIEKQIAEDTVTDAIICDKAWAIYVDLLRQTPYSCRDEASGGPFKTSCSWFQNFKKTTSIHLLVRHEEATRADLKATEDYLKTFARIVGSRGTHSAAVNLQLWRDSDSPSRIYKTARRKQVPGHKSIS